MMHESVAGLRILIESPYDFFFLEKIDTGKGLFSFSWDLLHASALAHRFCALSLVSVRYH